MCSKFYFLQATEAAKKGGMNMEYYGAYVEAMSKGGPRPYDIGLEQWRQRYKTSDWNSDVNTVGHCSGIVTSTLSVGHWTRIVTATLKCIKLEQ